MDILPRINSPIVSLYYFWSARTEHTVNDSQHQQERCNPPPSLELNTQKLVYVKITV